jgi:hypothetical protein
VKNFLNNNKNIHKNAKKKPKLDKTSPKAFLGSFFEYLRGGGHL